jgi:hypothetical protein
MYETVIVLISTGVKLGFSHWKNSNSRCEECLDIKTCMRGMEETEKCELGTSYFQQNIIRTIESKEVRQAG